MHLRIPRVGSRLGFIRRLGSMGALVLAALSLRGQATFHVPTGSQSSDTVITGSDGLVKTGAGTQILTANNTYTGNTTISGGTLVLAGDSRSGAFAIGAEAVLELAPAADTSYSGSTAFTGSGTLRKTGSTLAVWGGSVATFALGAGSLIDVQGGTLSGGAFANEDWTQNLARLNVAAGAMFAGVEANVRVDALSGAGTISSGYNGEGYQAFAFGVNGGTGTFSGALADSDGVIPGNYVKAGAGTQTLAGASSFTGTMTVEGGTLVLTHAGALGSTAGGTTVNSGATLLLSGVALGAEALTLSGDGAASAGAVAGTGTASHAGTITLAGNTSIGTASGGTLTLSGALGETGGARSLTKVGGGTLVLTGARSYTGGTTISAGTLQLGNGGASGSVLGNIVNSAALIFDHSGSVDYSGAISGTGAVTKAGSGALTLSGNNTYTGATTVSGGRLIFTGDLTSPSFTLGSGATLELNSSGRDYGSDVTFTGGGTLVKTGSGNIRWTGPSAAFALGAGSLIDVQVGEFGGGSFGNENWTNNLSSLHVASGATFSGVEANVRVDALTGEGAIRSGFNGSGYQSFTFGVNNGSGIFSGILADTEPAHPGSFTKAGTGTQTLSGNNTYTGITTISAGTLVMGHASALGSGSVSISAGATLDSATYGFALTRASGAGTITGSGVYSYDSTGSLSLPTNLTGSASLTKSGSGTLTLTGSLSYSGGTTLAADRLNIVGFANISGTISAAARTTLQLGTSATSSGRTGSNGVGAYSPGEAGSNGADFGSRSTLLLSGALNGGRGGDGAPVGPFSSPGGDGGNGARGASFGANATVTLESSGAAIRGGNGGAGGFRRAGGSGGYGLWLEANSIVSNAGTIAGGNAGSGLSESNGYGAGGIGLRALNNTTVSNTGTIAAGNRAANVPDTGTGPTAVILGANSTLTNTGTIRVGTGAAQAAAISTGTGTTIINSGTITGNGTVAIYLGANSTLELRAGSQITGNVSGGGGENSTLVLGGGSSSTLTGTIGAGGTYFGFTQLVKNGASHWTVTGTSTLGGTTRIAEGTLQFGSQASLYNNVTSNWTAANIIIEPGATAAFSVGGSGQFTAGNIATLAALGTATGGFKSGASLGLDTSGASGGIFTLTSGLVDPNGGANSLALTKLGVGTLRLPGTSTYTGGTVISAGTLQFGIGAGTISLPSTGSVTIGSGAAIAYDFTGLVTEARTLSGNGTITKRGAGTLVLAGTNTFTSNTTITGGLIQFTSLDNFGSGNITINGGGLRWSAGNSLDISTRLNPIGASGATFDTNGNDVAVSGSISGNGRITKTGSGILTLSRHNTYTGGTTLSTGTLIAGDAGAFGTGAISVTGGTLDLNGKSALNAIMAQGGLLKGLSAYTGTATLSGSASFGGTMAGTTVVANNGSLDTTGATFTGPTTVQSGGRISGTGTLASLTILSGGVLAPGSSPGHLNISGNLSLTGSTLLEFAATGLRGTAYDAITVGGPLIFGGTLTVSLLNGFTPAAGHMFDVFDFSTATSSGAFATLNLPALSSGLAWNTSALYTAGILSVSTSAIPEPSTYGLFAGVLILGLATWRRLR
ncbi:MAG: autotransporter-associated beta strand repeat-containing protein [Verrucomicrobiota bacterium]